MLIEASSAPTSSDDWLYSYRYEALVSNRDKFDLIEALTWNDYGESSYIGPIEGAQPNSQAWVDGYDHTPLLEVSRYYNTAFKTGSYPAITQDKIYLSARTHPAYASASYDGVPSPSGREFVGPPPLLLLFVLSYPSPLTLPPSSFPFNLVPRLVLRPHLRHLPLNRHPLLSSRVPDLLRPTRSHTAVVPARRRRWHVS